MPEFDTVFVLVVYRNIMDLEEFLQTLGGFCISHRTVVVNSYCDDTTRDSFEKLCREHDCDFINAENKGYGSGNNAGIAFASAHYTFSYLIVCNPDVTILNMPKVQSDHFQGPCIFGPDIKTLTGKRQNPCMVFYSPLREALFRRFAKHPGSSLPFYLAVALNKLERIIFNTLFSRRKMRVYSLHGSFLIFTPSALTLLGLPFDPGMFLFREEDYLARSAKKLGIKMIYEPAISVRHKEDGSVSFIAENVREHTLASLRRYFGLT